jgi:hypothetical protein
VELFFQLEKVDPQSGIFSAICASERVDKDREQLDYVRSKPLFESAQAEMFKTSGGKNYFPINLQHKQDSPVGRVIEPLEFNDAAKTIRCTGKLEDLNARHLMATGVLTGVSIEGAYLDKQHLSNGVTKYVAKPIRIAVCDVPCNPDCTFDLVKSDGSTLPQHFKHSTVIRDNPNERVAKSWGRIFDQPGDTPYERTCHRENYRKAVAGDYFRKFPAVSAGPRVSPNQRRANEPITFEELSDRTPSTLTDHGAYASAGDAGYYAGRVK